MADKDFKVKSGLDLGTPLPLTEGGTGQTSASNALNALLPLQTSNSGKVLSTDGTSTSWLTLPNGYLKGDTASRPGSPALGDIYSNTETGYIEVYTSAGWSQLGVIPTSATIGTPTDVGTNISYGSGSVDVAFSAGSGGGLVSSFTAVSNPGSISASGSSSPIRVSGLTQGTSYTFTVTSTNGYGNALPSSSSSSLTPTSLPQAPTIGTASNPSGSAFNSTAPASVTFTAGATGGKSITNYKYSTDGSTYTALSPEDTSSPVTIPGLTSGQSYTIRLRAVNANGDSVASSASNSVTVSTVPQAPTIGTATAGNLSATVTWTANANGNSAITGFTVTSSPGNITANAAANATSASVTGLTASTAYTFTVTATNANGTSSSSAASNSITPVNPFPVIAEYNSSGTFTVNNGFPATIAMYAIGGGGNSGGNTYVGNSNQLSFTGGGGGGGGRYSSGNATINSNLTITVGGAGSTSNITGGTNLSATGGGNGGSPSGANNVFQQGTPGNGGSGGSGGGGGGIFVGDDNNGMPNHGYYPGGGGGSGGNSGGNSSGASGGSGTGIAQSSSGGSGGLGPNDPAYGGINVGGSNYFAGRGLGGGYYRGATGGAVLIIQNA